MPTYAYACTACDHRFEAKQSFSDSSLTDCPECTGQVRKLFSSVGIVFKGSGFYRNDSRKPESTSAGNGSTSEKGSSEKGSPDTRTSDTGASGTGTPGTGGSEKSTPAPKKEPASTGASKAAGSAA